MTAATGAACSTMKIGAAIHSTLLRRPMATPIEMPRVAETMSPMINGGGGRGEGGKSEIDRHPSCDFPRPAEQRDGCQPPPESLVAAAGRFARSSGNAGRNGIFKPRIHSRRTPEVYCVPTLASALFTG